MKTKNIEKLGFQALRTYLIEKYGSKRVQVRDIRNGGNVDKDFGCDAIVTLDGKKLYIELKASKSNSLPTNMRFAHQTMATMYNAGVLPKMIVAYVYNLGVGVRDAKFKFFRFGDFKAKQILIEPHFIIQPRRLMRESEGLFRDSLDQVIDAGPSSNDIEKLFNTRVSKHMKLKSNT